MIDWQVIKVAGHSIVYSKQLDRRITAEEVIERIVELKAACIRKNKDGASAYQWGYAQAKRIVELEAKSIQEIVTHHQELRECAESGRKRIAGLEEVAKFHQLAFSDVDDENRIFIKEVEEKNKRVAELEEETAKMSMHIMELMCEKAGLEERIAELEAQ